MNICMCILGECIPEEGIHGLTCQCNDCPKEGMIYAPTETRQWRDVHLGDIDDDPLSLDEVYEP